MDVAVIGASGDIGRLVVLGLVQERLLAPEARLQLVGRRGGSSERTLYGLASDLMDAYAERASRLEVVLEPEDIRADIIVMCAGITFPRHPAERVLSRQAFTETNSRVFHQYARAIARHSRGTEIVIHISNPVELGVHVFSRYLPRERVVGIGAYLDSLRFQREISMALGLPRRRVQGLVGGEHGPDLIPLWSTVKLQGLSPREEEEAIEIMRASREGPAPPSNTAALEEAITILQEQGPEAAFRRIDGMPFDFRPVVRPFTTHYTGSKTVIGPAGATLKLIRALLEGERLFCSLQVKLEGDLLNLRGVCGVPVILGSGGVEGFIDPGLSPGEREALQVAVEAIRARVEGF